MTIRFGILQTRVARRVLFLFILCAVLPVSALSVLSYFSVRNQLTKESEDRLIDATKNSGLALVERLQFLETSARLVLAPLIEANGPGETRQVNVRASHEEFEAALVQRPEGGSYSLFGTMAEPPLPSPGELDHLAGGLAVVRAGVSPDGTPEVLMGLEAEGGEGSTSFLWARLSLEFLLRTVEEYSGLRSSVGFCVLLESDQPLFCSHPHAEALGEAIISGTSEGSRTERNLPYQLVNWIDSAGTDYFAAVRPVFLRPQFFIGNLTVSVSEAKATALANMVRFQWAFLGVILIGIVAVALLSNIQIRKSMDPLLELHEGTKRLATGDFSERVSVSSSDEFEDLAESFNTMAVNLESQFHTLATIAELDRAILSALDSTQIIDTALERVGDLLTCDRIAVCRLDWIGSREGRLRVGSSASKDLGPEVRALLSNDDKELLDGIQESLALYESDGASQYFGASTGEVQTAIMVPLRTPEGLAGYLAVGRVGKNGFSQTDRSRMEQIGKQISVALSNAWLLEELDRMSWGALTALGRTIDAKSPWTSGHSEQVAVLSEALGRGMGLPKQTLTALQRGGLVHDIGKIAVPGRILDKEEELLPEEIQIIRSHPEVGVRILEPVPAMEAILPMVLHHHEAWDGSGYPIGLKGEDIPLEARIMAVADQFEALSADRPYRPRFSIEETVAILREKAGSELDPQIVSTFIELLESGRLPVQLQPTSEVVS